MKKNAFISILFCFVFIFTLSSKTHASEHTDAEVTAATEHVAGVVTGYTGSIKGQGYPNYPNEQYKTVAVHQKSSTNTDPIFVFGSTILIKDDLYVDGYGYKILFHVTDTGDLKRKRDLYWFDVYFGADNAANQKNADNFGVKNTNVAYTAY